MDEFVAAQKRLLTIERDDEMQTLGEQLANMSGPQCEAAGRYSTILQYTLLILKIL